MESQIHEIQMMAERRKQWQELEQNRSTTKTTQDLSLRYKMFDPKSKTVMKNNLINIILEW